ncbi:MAG: GspE/PulE family protein [Bacteriovoracia bacterium]
MFGEYLVGKNIISREALNDALRAQRYMRLKIGRVLRDLGHFDQRSLDRSLWFYFKPECRDSVEVLRQKLEVARKDERNLCWGVERTLIYIGQDEKGPTFLATYFRDQVVEEWERRSEKSMRLLTVGPEVFDFLQSTISEIKSGPGTFEVSKRETEEQYLRSGGPYSSLFRECIERAKTIKASDIHIEPKENSIEIRFRVHGNLFPWKMVAKEHLEQLVNLIKRLCSLDIAVTDRPQDGRASFPSLSLDVRASFLKTIYGEKIVLRLLEQDRDFDLKKLGIDDDALKNLTRSVEEKNGLVIISGPTGSGKTTTLYSLLASLNHQKLNITTLEDPVEYRLPGINQVQVSKRLDFNSALRALMRQDPDVILVGEIRDKETADLCFKAAATGHLVISTLHANGAREVVERLETIGIDRYSIASNLRFSGAQRLIQKLCLRCSRVPGKEEVREFLRLAGTSAKEDGQFRILNPEGCENCQHGVVGRIPVLEYINQSQIKHVLKSRDSNTQSAFVGLRDSAVKYAVQGIIGMYEALGAA